MRTLRSIERCQVALILFDAKRGFDVQDLHIVESTMERRRPALIAVNKWDLVEKETNTAREYEAFLKEKLGIHDHIPVMFVSALTKQRIYKLIEKAQFLNEEQCKRIETSELNDVLLPQIDLNPPKSSSPKEIKIKYITQVKTAPPMFAFFCKEPKLVQESYKRYLLNQLRAHFGFAGVPITLTFKQK
jgi:GTP-binding protein